VRALNYSLGLPHKELVDYRPVALKVIGICALRILCSDAFQVALYIRLLLQQVAHVNKELMGIMLFGRVEGAFEESGEFFDLCFRSISLQHIFCEFVQHVVAKHLLLVIVVHSSYHNQYFLRK
jgi:hypothetical protein